MATRSHSIAIYFMEGDCVDMSEDLLYTVRGPKTLPDMTWAGAKPETGQKGYDVIVDWVCAAMRRTLLRD